MQNPQNSEADSYTCKYVVSRQFLFFCCLAGVKLGIFLTVFRKSRFEKNYMGSHTCNPAAQEVEAGGLGIEGQPQLRSKFEASLSYMRP